MIWTAIEAYIGWTLGGVVLVFLSGVLFAILFGLWTFSVWVRVRFLGWAWSRPLKPHEDSVLVSPHDARHPRNRKA